MLVVKNHYKYYNTDTEQYYYLLELSSDKNSSVIETVEFQLPDIEGAEFDVFLASVIDELNALYVSKDDFNNSLTYKVDKIDGKILTSNDFTDNDKEKLELISDKANRYIHPQKHPISMILESDLQKILTLDERQKLLSIEYDSNKYIHPDFHSADIITETENNRFITTDLLIKLENVDTDSNNYVHPAKHSPDIIEETFMKNLVSLYQMKTWDEKADIQDIDDRIHELTEVSPNVIDTLSELSNVLDHDDSLSVKLTTQISSKVDKISGKQLSTEDFTSPYRVKLDSIDEYANKYIHPNYHTVDQIEGLQDSISNNDMVYRNYLKSHEKIHKVDDQSHHIGISGVVKNNFVIFDEYGFFVDRGKKIPDSEVVGTSDIQTLENKNIDNSPIGMNTPSSARFTTMSGGTPSIIITSDKLLGINECLGHIVYVESNAVITLLPCVSLYEGSNITIYITDNYNVEIKPHEYNRFRINGVSGKYGHSIFLREEQAGKKIVLHRDSDKGWTAIDLTGNWTYSF